MNAKRPGEEGSLREQFAWTYGHLAMAHAAIEEGATRYERRHYMIRTRFRSGYLSGKVTMKALLADEKVKIAYGTTCCYCGAKEKLTLDHVIPRLQGGPDAAENISYACQSCNSSKGAKDMVLWLTSKGRFPALLTFRRYLKLAAHRCESASLMAIPWADVPETSLPFDKRSLRVKWPPPRMLDLWPDPAPARTR